MNHELPTTNFTLRGEHVTLGQLLKLSGIIGSGGEAKLYLSYSEVLVNGLSERRRGRKLRAGDVILAPGETPITIIADDNHSEAGSFKGTIS